MKPIVKWLLLAAVLALALVFALLALPGGTRHAEATIEPVRGSEGRLARRRPSSPESPGPSWARPEPDTHAATGPSPRARAQLAYAEGVGDAVVQCMLPAGVAADREPLPDQLVEGRRVTLVVMEPQGRRVLFGAKPDLTHRPQAPNPDDFVEVVDGEQRVLRDAWRDAMEAHRESLVPFRAAKVAVVRWANAAPGETTPCEVLPPDSGVRFRVQVTDPEGRAVVGAWVDADASSTRTGPDGIAHLQAYPGTVDVRAWWASDEHPLERGPIEIARGRAMADVHEDALVTLQMGAPRRSFADPDEAERVGRMVPGLDAARALADEDARPILDAWRDTFAERRANLELTNRLLRDQE